MLWTIILLVSFTTIFAAVICGDFGTTRWIDVLENDEGEGANPHTVVHVPLSDLKATTSLCEGTWAVHRLTPWLLVGNDSMVIRATVHMEQNRDHQLIPHGPPDST